jgi:hypothetical protein
MEARTSLMELLEGLHDPRHSRGNRHPLPARLGLAVVAMLAGMTSGEAIVHYNRSGAGSSCENWGSPPGEASARSLDLALHGGLGWYRDRAKMRRERRHEQKLPQARKEGRPHSRPRTASLKGEEVRRLKAERVSHSGGREKITGPLGWCPTPILYDRTRRWWTSDFLSSASAIARRLGIGRTSVRRILRAAG